MSFFTEKDAKLLIHIDKNQLLPEMGMLAFYFSNNYMPLNILNSTLSAFISLGLIKKSGGRLFLTDKSTLLLCGKEYLVYSDLTSAVLDRLSNLSLPEDFTVEEVVDKKEYDRILKDARRINRQSSSDNKIFTIKNFALFICYAIVLFFAGFTIGNLVAKNYWGGIFLAPVAIALSVLFFLLTFDEIKKKESPVDLVFEIKKPTFIALLLNGIIAFFSIVAFFVLDVRYFFSLVLELVALAIVLFKTSKYSRKSLPKKVFTTRSLCAKVYTDKYYVCGIDILDDANRIPQVGTTAILLNPITKSVLVENAEVYKAKVNGIEFFYAIATLGQTKLLYKVTKEDVVISNFLWTIDDDFRHLNDVKVLIEKKSELLERSNDYKYSNDGLLRVSSCVIGDKYAVNVDLLELKPFDGVDVVDNQYNLSDGFLLAEEFVASWSTYSRKLFDSNDSCEEYLQKLISEISYDKVNACLLSCN